MVNPSDDYYDELSRNRRRLSEWRTYLYLLGLAVVCIAVALTTGVILDLAYRLVVWR